MLVRPTFFIMGLNFHTLPHILIQLDLKPLSPQKVSSEGGAVPEVAPVGDEQAFSLVASDGSRYPWYVSVQVCYGMFWTFTTAHRAWRGVWVPCHLWY